VASHNALTEQSGEISISSHAHSKILELCSQDSLNVLWIVCEDSRCANELHAKGPNASSFVGARIVNAGLHIIWNCHPLICRKHPFRISNSLEVPYLELIRGLTAQNLSLLAIVDFGQNVGNDLVKNERCARPKDDKYRVIHNAVRQLTKALDVAFDYRVRLRSQ
jgi:hypothetical protein